MTAAAIMVANAPCSWGVLEFEGVGEGAGPKQVLDEMAAAGYSGTELGDWGFLPTEAAALRRELESRRLQMVGAFLPAALADRATHQAAVEQAVRIGRLLAEVSERPLIVLADENGADPVRTGQAGRVRPDQGLNEAQWEVFAEGVELVARAALERCGARTVFHHHCAGFIETPAEVSELLDRTDPELVGLCLDTGHLLYGGGDPLALLEARGDRVWHVHFKDCSRAVADRARREGLDYFEAVRAGLFCELGQGEVDFRALLGELRRRGYQGWIVVEQDVFPGFGAPAESARRSRRFLGELGL